MALPTSKVETFENLDTPRLQVDFQFDRLCAGGVVHHRPFTLTGFHVESGDIRWHKITAPDHRTASPALTIRFWYAIDHQVFERDFLLALKEITTPLTISKSSGDSSQASATMVNI